MVKRVAVFTTDDFLPPAGGAEVALGEMIQRFPDIHFDIFCARIRKEASAFEERGKVRFFRFGVGIPKFDKILFASQAHKRAFHEHGQEPYDLIWSVMASYSGFAARKMKIKTGIPFLLTLQEGDPIEYILKKVRFVRSTFGDIFARADGLQAISSFLKDWGVSMGFRGKSACVIPNGVDIAQYTAPLPAGVVEKQREEFGFSQDATVLITTSRLVKKNGVGDVISALVELPKDVCFVICGSGELQSALQAQVRELGLTERVRFLGFVGRGDIPRMLKASDIFIRPSLTEGLGNSFLEAMATEMPVIATLVGGIPDFLTDGETGFVCEPGDPDSVVRAVTRIQETSPEDIKRIKATAKHMVEDRYSWKTVVAGMKEMFHSLTTS